MTKHIPSYNFKKYDTVKEKIRKVKLDSLKIDYDIEQQKYFTEGFTEKLNEIKSSQIAYNRFRTVETDWENILQKFDEETGETSLWLLYAWKGWKIDLGKLPENIIPYIDVRILYRSVGEDESYVPSSQNRQSWILELEDTDIDEIKQVYVIANLYFFEDTKNTPWGGQAEARNNNMEAKVIVTIKNLNYYT